LRVARRAPPRRPARAQCADHRQNAGDVALEDDTSLQIREGENEIRIERQDLWGGCTAQPETPTIRSCSPSRYSVSTVSSVRQTIRRGGNWRMPEDIANYRLDVTVTITRTSLPGLTPLSIFLRNDLKKHRENA
jgi:hypothetical protein